MTQLLGLIVNPIAGVGGRAGLKGSDGIKVQALALLRGGSRRSAERAVRALAVVAAAHPGAEIVTVAGEMGENAVRAAGLHPRVVSAPQDPRATVPADTVAATTAIVEAGANLVLFVGGDGTARDVCAGMAAVRSAGGSPGTATANGGTATATFGTATANDITSTANPVAALGIPAGVKMYSACFAVSPVAAGALAAQWLSRRPLPVRESEVLDVVEEQLRHGRVEPRLFGYLPVPFVLGRTQARKAPTPSSQSEAARSAARGVVKQLQPGMHYLLGPGSTVGEIAQLLGLPKTPLGVDVVLDGEIVCSDASERDLLALLSGVRAKAVVTVIGGQGFLLGRGNQQLSARVVRAIGDDPLIAVATEQKLIDLQGRPLLVDTGDAELDARLAGFIRVTTGAAAASVYPVQAPENQTPESEAPESQAPGCEAQDNEGARACV
ncbi:ATP-NAD kinase family protein [Rathayibacter soli]|uniref:ATP-NAD kinase family protein n=1 Tax=Rathayibacter soli TaxID=3144168 RepID=UPI0027E518A6|nr:NAD(+)/NADH kinase [Glaciibacter superstes]